MMPMTNVNAADPPASPIDGGTVASPAGAIRLVDRSSWPRLGLKGSRSQAHLAASGVIVPGVHSVAVQADGTLVARFAPNEFLALGATPEPGTFAGFPAFEMGGDAPAGLCPVPRAASHAWFCAEGARLAELFAKLCGLDLRPHRFADLRAAQTTVARTTAILIRNDRESALRFHVLVDWTTAAYLWDVMRDAMSEY
jgi:sarcosine oxidase subunit gamma